MSLLRCMLLLRSLCVSLLRCILLIRSLSVSPYCAVRCIQSHSHNVRVLLCCVSPTMVYNHLLLFLTTVFLPSVQNVATAGSLTTFRSENTDQDSYITVKYVYPLINFVIRAVFCKSYCSAYNNNSVFHENILILVRLSQWRSLPSGCEWWRRHIDVDRSCEYIESAVADHRQGTLL